MLYLISCLCVGSILPYDAYLVSQANGCNDSKCGHNGSLGESIRQQGFHSNLSVFVPFVTVLLQGATEICRSSPFVETCRVA